ncbi:MAG: PD-(D/E)XK nuclease family protein [Pseudomonadota bacterium]
MASQISHWFSTQGLSARDAVVLLPYAGLLPALRDAFAELGGWQPRIETTRSWAAALGPPRAAGAGQIGFDPVTDRLSAALLLRRQAGAAAWARRDANGFGAAVLALVDAAQAFLRAAHERAPALRDAFWAAWRDALPPVAGPGASERWLARIALEWAASADAPSQDLLWQQRPVAWVAIQIGGRDAFTEALLGAATERATPVLRLDADPPAQSPFDAVARLPAPRRWLCDGLEGEAQAATLAVLEALDNGHTPVALIAQDRLVVRRIRALLERAQVTIRDETGWTLSTTRAAARLMALLRAAEPAASRDALLDWLKSEPVEAAALQRLEDAWRRDRPPDPSAQALCDLALARLQPLRSGVRPLSVWLRAVSEAAPALLQSLSGDAAGRPLLAALHLDAQPPSPSWQAAADATPLDLAAFSAWVNATLETANFIPQNAGVASVLITPLASAMLRPFAAVVMPGCDNLHLGAATSEPSLLPDSLLRDFGMGDAQQRRERERVALAHLLRTPRLTLLRRRSDGGEPLAPSLLVEHAWQARRRLAQAAPDEVAAPLPLRSVSSRPHPRPSPSAAQALPERLSASAVESLRACPYRFFAQSLLRLREAPELEAELEKRDFGTWLHGALLRFHMARPELGAPASDAARLRDAADAEQAALGLDAAQLLPFRAAFDSFSTHYLGWLHARDAEGWRYESGELALRRDDPRLRGLQLDGRIDRIDLQPASGTHQLIDYKTGNAQALTEKVADPLEDTQLAFYAALLGAEQPVRAIYLALADRKAPELIEHVGVRQSAERLVQGLADELDRIRDGAGMPALGEGAICEYCEMRGLCRRDHWLGGASS